MSNEATGSFCLVVDAATKRMFVFVRLRLPSFEEIRAKNEDESGERLVPIEFGGVRCRFDPSSVFEKENEKSIIKQRREKMQQ